MSSVTISYSSLKNASGEAKDVSKKLTAYANSLNNNVYKKLSSYSGDHTSNINTAYSQIGKKINILNSRADAYTKYASDLLDLRDNCKSTDKAVKSMVSGLTGTFKSAHGISNNSVVNAISYFCTWIDNSTNIGRWVSNMKDKWNSSMDYIKQTIEDWWDYEGGKQLITGAAITILKTIAAVCTIITAIGALIAGGTFLAMIAAVASLVVGVISLVNACTDAFNEGRAYAARQAGDPAAGYRYSDENTLTDTMRAEADSNIGLVYTIAAIIDGVNFVCSVISIVSSLGKLVKNAYKWTSGSMTDIKDLRIRDILTKDNLAAFGDKIKLSVKLGWLEVKSAIQMGDFSSIKTILVEFGTDFLNNLKVSLTDMDSIKSMGSTTGNYASILESLSDNGFNFKTILYDIGLLQLVLPNIEVLSTDQLVTYDPSKMSVLDQYSFSSFNPIGDIQSLISKISKKISSGKNIFSNLFGTDSSDLSIGLDLAEKLSGINSGITCQVPQINIPKIDINLQLVYN